ncbi:hypothetical protein H4S03_007900, partial [Coemansia sp. S3946]
MYVLPSAYTKTAIHWVKLALASAIAAAAAFELLLVASMLSLPGILNVFTISLLIRSVAYVVAVSLHYYEQTRAHKSSDILLLYWLTTIVVSLVTLRTDFGSRYSPFATYPAVRMARYVMLVSTITIFGAELVPRNMSEYVLAEDSDDDV